MTKALKYPGANLKDRWYQGVVSGARQPTIDKLVWHSTETPPGNCPTYAGGKAAPTLTVDPWNYKVWQHFDANVSAKALVDPYSTSVKENRDNVAQVEVIGYSQFSSYPKYWLGALPDKGLRFLAEIAKFYNEEWGTPLVITPLKWTWDARNDPHDPRYSGPKYDAFKGHLGHRHVSGNHHWDPSLNVKKILEYAKGAKVASNPAPTTNTNDKDWDNMDQAEFNNKMNAYFASHTKAGTAGAMSTVARDFFRTATWQAKFGGKLAMATVSDIVRGVIKGEVPAIVASEIDKDQAEDAAKK